MAHEGAVERDDLELSVRQWHDRWFVELVHFNDCIPLGDARTLDLAMAEAVDKVLWLLEQLQRKAKELEQA